MYRDQRNYENLNRAKFIGAGAFDIPRILAEVPATPQSWIGFNYAKSCKDPANKAIHFFVDDYQFNRLWTNPDAYLDMLRRFKAVCTPDFSTYTDFPKAVQIWNHYRKHWLGAYWQGNGITVIPTISWSDESSFEWCFDGEPVGGAVAVSSVGTRLNKRAAELFRLGYDEMLRRLNPLTIDDLLLRPCAGWRFRAYRSCGGFSGADQGADYKTERKCGIIHGWTWRRFRAQQQRA